MRRHTYIVGVFSTILIVVGTLLKFLHLPGAAVILSIGIISFVVYFSVSFLIDRLTLQTRRGLQISTIILFASLQCAMLFIFFSFLRLPPAEILQYASLILLAVYFVFFSTQTEGRKLEMRKDRQLAAILFTDVVGFTAMMEQDEDKALRVLDQNRKIQKQVIRKQRGKWLKEMGDGSMAIFYTATEAVSAASEIQQKIQEKGEYNVRMGIHISEIVFTDKDVFGDGVNVAARISDKASANEICISEAVFHNVRNREDMRITPVGETKFKNVSDPLKIYKIETQESSKEVFVRKLVN